MEKEMFTVKKREIYEIFNNKTNWPMDRVSTLKKAKEEKMKYEKLYGRKYEDDK